MTLENTDIAGARSEQGRSAKWRVPIAIQRIVLIVVLLAIWELGSSLTGGEFWVSRPLLIVDRLISMIQSGEFAAACQRDHRRGRQRPVAGRPRRIPLGIALERFHTRPSSWSPLSWVFTACACGARSALHPLGRHRARLKGADVLLDGDLRLLDERVGRRALDRQGHARSHEHDAGEPLLRHPSRCVAGYRAVDPDGGPHRRRFSR